MYFFDAHCDYLYNSVKKRPTYLTDKSVKAAKLKKSIFAVFEGGGRDDAEAQISALERYNGERYGREPQAFIAFEGLSWAHSLFDAEYIIARKPVYASPTWNKQNDFGGSCHGDGALTKFGMCFLNELSQNGIIIDLAHSGKNMFYSCVDRFERIMFSHGNVYEICNNNRNINASQIRLLIERRGFFGLSFYPAFVGSNEIPKLFEHIEYVLNMGGEDILGFGSDLDGCPETVGGYNDAGIFCAVYEEMLRRNYHHLLIEKLTHGNLERITSR